uniref:Uncharacterized protein n=1 Tax=Caenorhabditis japonica TaxID=281687 RepID=A0A8R1I5Q2_CAEJA
MSKSQEVQAGTSKSQDVKEMFVFTFRFIYNECTFRESSGDDDDEFIFKKLLKKEQFKLQDPFRIEIENSIKYLGALKGLTDALQKMCISGTSYHFDEKRQVPYSGWRYLTGYLRKIEFASKNQPDAKGLIEACDELGWAEEKKFAQIRNPDERSNIYLAVGDQREKMEELNKAIALSVKICNRRRKKVEKSQIMKDLKDQCPKYKAAVLQLDDECRDMENYKSNIRMNRPIHHTHIKKCLVMCQELSVKKNDILKNAVAKREKRTGTREERKIGASQKSFIRRLKKKST